MKAAVLHELGRAPKYEDFHEPVVQNDNQVIITIKAAAVKNLDKARASGKHYASYTDLPVVVGQDGVGLLPDGTRVYAAGITGTMAEKALTDKRKYVVIPDGIDDATAAALPNTVIGAALALLYRAGLKNNDTVLINGATGVTGAAAVQMAKHYGAKRVIATGRNQAALERLLLLGADEIISLKQDDSRFISRLKEINTESHIDIVIDYTWGHPVELIIVALKGGSLHSVAGNVRLVTCGSMAGEMIQLPSAVLRSSPIEILGSGFGSLSAEALAKMNVEILPEMMQLAATGKLKIETTTVPLKDIEMAWDMDVEPGKRLIVFM
jgi:NADPH:quinone reductase-like Zn-dependent oxidoreductase